MTTPDPPADNEAAKVGPVMLGLEVPLDDGSFAPGHLHPGLPADPDEQPDMFVLVPTRCFGGQTRMFIDRYMIVRVGAA